MKHLFVLVFTLFMQVAGMAQQGIRQQELPFRWSARFNFPALADPLENNISFGAEYGVNSRLSVVTDIGYIFYSQYFSQNKTTNGVIIRPGIRYYTSDRRIFFVEALPFYKQVNNRMEGWLGKDCINGVPVYEQFQRFTYRKRVLGLNLQAGVQAVLSKDRRLALEFYAGLSIRSRWMDIKDEPRACLLNEGDFLFGDGNTQKVLPGLPIGIRLVYSFAKTAAKR